MSTERFVCPDCGLREMIKVEKKETGTYMLQCQKCNAERGPLPIQRITKYNVKGSP